MDDFLQGLLALHPDVYERYARRAASAGGWTRLAGTDDGTGAAASRTQCLDEDPLSAVEGARFPTPVIVSGVAILPLHGVLAPSIPWWEHGTSTETFAMQLLAALDDPAVREIVIRINSPGGHVAGTPELADLIYRSRGVKPITGFGVNGMICSAAYYIGSACDKLYATPSTEVGSVGVIWAHYDLTQMAAEAGVKVTLVSIPDDKAIGYDQRPLSEEDRGKLLATWLQPAYDQFVGAVARNRGVTADKVKAEYGRGLTYQADEAARRGMLDGVRDWHEFLQGLGAQPATESFGGSDPPQFASKEQTMKFSARLKAIMLTAGILEAMDVDDPACAMALRVWCTARGEQVPSDEKAAEAMIRASFAVAPKPESKPETKPAVTGAAPPAVPPAEPVDVAAEIQRALTAEAARQSAIRDRAALLRSQIGLEITDADLQTALSTPGMTAERFSESALTNAANSQRPVTRIENGPAALDKFTQAAASAILMRAGPDLARTARAEGARPEQTDDNTRQLVQQDSHMVREIAGMSFLQIAQESVRLAGQRPAENSDEAWASSFLQLAGQQHRRFAMGHPGIERGLGASTPIHGPGNFPNLMGLVAQSTSYFAINVAPVSYWRWATRHDDALNFNPQEILQFYGSTRLDEHVDTHPPGQASFSEQAAWIQVNQYSKAAKLSSRMIIQNQLTTFMRMLVQFQIAIERTVNELVVNHLIDNTACPFDGVALFHAASHVNDRALGNPPSITENKAMRLLLAQQTVPGDSLEAGLTFDFALYGSDNINAAELQYLPAYRIVPADQDDVNQFTGRVEPIYEPLLSAGDPIWYAGSRSPLLTGIIYSFLSGSGPGGRRVTYFDPATQCQSFDYYVEAGSALVNYQPYARNAGTGAS